jgi:hypothetical protein
LLQRYVFAKEDVKEIRVLGSTGGPKASLDVRVTDLYIRALPAAIAQRPATKEVYQDFRGNPPALPEFRLAGPDLKAVTKSEAAGLRITLPKTRKAHFPVEIAPTFDITGDFEITGTYELLAADMPADGYGVGVALNIATTNDLQKFLKISRVMRPDDKSVYMAEYWKKGADDWSGPQLATEVRSGQLRLVREGSRSRCQVSEGPGKEFMTIFEKEDFGTEAIQYLRFQVTDGLKPGYAVDARLVDLRVRYDIVASAKVANAVAPAPDAPSDDGRKADSRDRLALKVVVGIAVALLFTIALGWFVRVRRRRGAQNAPESDVIPIEPAAAIPVIVACTGCSKKLRIKPSLAGKKVKCPKCGQAVHIPSKDKA